MTTKKATVNKLRKAAQMRRIDVRVVSALPAPIVRKLYVSSGWGNLYLSPFSTMDKRLYRQMRRFLRGMGYEVATVDNRTTDANVMLAHSENGHKINIHIDRPHDTIQCEYLIAQVVTKPVYEWVCPTDPAFEERKALSARLERAIAK